MHHAPTIILNDFFISEGILKKWCITVDYKTNLRSGTGVRTWSNSSFAPALPSASELSHINKHFMVWSHVMVIISALKVDSNVADYTIFTSCTNSCFMPARHKTILLNSHVYSHKWRCRVLLGSIHPSDLDFWPLRATIVLFWKICHNIKNYLQLF